MRWLTDIRYRMRSLWTRSGAEAELRDEFDFHVEMEARKLVFAPTSEPENFPESGTRDVSLSPLTWP